MNNLTTKIKQLAEKHGFDKVGITSAIQPEKSKLLETWLTNKYHGTMWWMAQWEEKRSDIQKFVLAFWGEFYRRIIFNRNFNNLLLMYCTDHVG